MSGCGSTRYGIPTATRHLAPLPLLPEPFDIAVTQPVEVRGCAACVQVVAVGGVVAVHGRHTAERLVIDPRHFEGESPPEVLAPLPLGRMGRRLAEIAAQVPEQRPVDLYAALAEVAR